MKNNWKQSYLDEEAENKRMLDHIGKFDSRGDAYTDNGTGITSRAHSILNLCHDIDSDARKLSAVGLDKVADNLYFIAGAIRALAEPIPKIVGQELTASLRHSEAVMGGLLMVGMKMAEQEGELRDLKAKS